MLELAILKLFCKDRGNWDKYNKLIKGLNLEKELSLIFNLVSAYYEEYSEHSYIVPQELKAFFSLEYASYKSPEIINKVIDDIFLVEISDSVIVDYVQSVIEKDTATKIINKLLKVVDESEQGLLLSIKDDLAQYESTIKVGTQTNSNFVSDDLLELFAEDERTNHINWRLKCLQEACGPLQEGLVHVYARTNCFHPDTEVLTPEGWMCVNAVTKNTRIAQVDVDRKVSFIQPLHIECHYEENGFQIKDNIGRVNLIVSDNHDMAFTYGKVKELRKKSIADICYFQGVKHHTSGIAKLNTHNVLSPIEKLQIAYQADGASRSYKDYGYSFSFSKERKINRLRDILNECGFEFTEYKERQNKYTSFYVKSQVKLYKDFSWVDLSTVDYAWSRAFLEELSHWDSHKVNLNTFRFCTTNKQVADKVQALATLSNCNVYFTTYEGNANKNSKHSTAYILNIRFQYKPVDGSSIHKLPIKLDCDVYCFTVPDGYLIVRYKNKVSICGNTGKTSWIASEVTNFAAQLNDDEHILYFNNEEAGRKVRYRLYSAMLNKPIEEIKQSYELTQKAIETYRQRGGNRLLLYDNETFSIEDIDRFCQEYNPKIIVVDVADKVTFKGVGNLEGQARLKELYMRYRALSKKYNCTVITSAQASAEAYGKKWIDLIHMDMSRTGKPSELDLSIGIGMSNDDGKENVRYIHVNKNKWLGVHARCTAIINPLTGRYTDV